MTAKLSSPATLTDLLALSEEARHLELIEGTLVEKGAATGERGAAQRKLAAYVDPFDQRHGGRFPGGWWFATEVDILFDDANVLRPDVVGWRRERVAQRPMGIPIHVWPDWVCEILSTNKRSDLIKKKRVYHRCQVPHYWMLDPIDGTLAVYRWSADGYVEILVAERGEVVRAEPFEALPVRVGVLLGEDEEEDGPRNDP